MESETLSGYVVHKFECISSGTNRVILDTRYITVDAVIDEKDNKQLSFDIYPYNYITGNDDQQLVISLGRSLKFGDRLSLKIDYKASHKATAVNWVPAKQTFGKKYKFMYTQCEAIECRSIVPIQDTPAIKSTFTATLSVDKNYIAIASALPVKNSPKDNSQQFKYVQSIPVPSYLLAIVAGNITYKSIGKRSGVYAEPKIIDKATYELDEMDKFVDIIEGVLTPYAWSIYSVVILPPSFPYGGMENPYLTFVSPSIILGDRSSAYVVAHEICHSWFGNQITGKNWTHFWLNEGFTVYSERLIAKILHGENKLKSQAKIGLDDFKQLVNDFKDNPEYTKLFPNVYREGPNNIMTNVAYEKGFLFLRFLESKVGSDNFYGFLRDYVYSNSYKSIDAFDMKAAFESYMNAHLDNKTILKKIDWDKWLFGSGLNNDIKDEEYITNEIKDALNLANKYISGNGEKGRYLTYNLDLKVIFMRKLDANTTNFNKTVLQKIDENYNVTKNETNPEVKFLWFKMCIVHKYDEVYKNNKTEAYKFLASIGRQKYIVPIYKALRDVNITKAKEYFDELRGNYHPIAERKIKKILGM